MSHHCQFRTTTALLLVITMSGSLALEPAAAQGGRSLEVDVADCIAIESPAERLRCFERRVDEAIDGQARRSDQNASQSDADAAPAAAEALPAAPPAAADAAVERERAARRVEQERSAEHEIELRGPSTAARAADARGAAADAEDVDSTGAGDAGNDDEQEIFSIVASVRDRPPSSYLITLENGQVWRRTRQTFYPLRAGHRVHIYQSNWGKSQRMTAEDLGGFIQVERVR